MPLHEAIRRYEIYLIAQGASSLTVVTMRSVLRFFERWGQGQQITMIEQLTPDCFSAYQEELTFRLTHAGRPLTILSQYRYLSILRGFGRYLLESDFLVANPTRKLHLPRRPKPLPKAVPDVMEAVRLVDRITPTLLGYRDRALLELLYSTGMRRGEVVNLTLNDLDLVGGYCWVREGKGRKDRVVPMGKAACERIQVYLDAVRPALLKVGKFFPDKDRGALFLNCFGRKLAGLGLYQIVMKAFARVNLSSQFTPHSLRHAAATHMLKNGAPIRYLQEFLGHESLESTQVYTRITIPELKEIHAKYHPREKEEGVKD